MPQDKNQASDPISKTQPQTRSSLTSYLLSAGLVAYLTWQGAKIYKVLNATPDDYSFDLADTRNNAYVAVRLSDFTQERLGPSPIREFVIGKPELLFGYFCYEKLDDGTYFLEIAVLLIL